MDVYQVDIPSFLMSRLWKQIKSIGAVTLFLGLIGCSIWPTKPDITMPTPKAYTDDQVLKTFAERRAKLRATATNSLTVDTIQELLRIKQQSQTTINISAAPAGGAGSSGTSMPNPLPTLSDLSVPATFGLPAEGQLRKRIALDQDITGYELLYLGDNHFLDKQKQAVLLRIDVSVNNYSYLTRALGTRPSFVMIGFKVSAKSDSEVIADEKISVYTLQPEYTSVVGEESLLSSRIENYAAQATAPYGGAVLTGGGAYQRGSEEGFLALVETPVQFAVYTDKPNQFAFAFGPRRRVIKRSWLNPYRMFGETHAINYEFEPGLRTVYALLALPVEATALDVKAKIHNDFESRDVLLTTARDEATQFSVPPDEPPACDPKSRLRCFSIPLLKAPPIPQLSEIIPKTIFTGTGSQLLIRSIEPVTSETAVFIGSLLVQKPSVTVLGRHRLKVELPYSQELDTAVKNTPCGKLDLKVYLVTPDRNPPFDLGEITLKASAPATTPPAGQCPP